MWPLLGHSLMKNSSKVEVRLLQPTMSSIKFVDGAFLAEHELQQADITDLRRAEIDAIEAVEALCAQRNWKKEENEYNRQ